MPWSRCWSRAWTAFVVSEPIDEGPVSLAVDVPVASERRGAPKGLSPTSPDAPGQPPRARCLRRLTHRLGESEMGWSYAWFYWHRGARRGTFAHGAEPSWGVGRGLDVRVAPPAPGCPPRDRRPPAPPPRLGARQGPVAHAAAPYRGARQGLIAQVGPPSRGASQGHVVRVAPPPRVLATAPPRAARQRLGRPANGPPGPWRPGPVAPAGPHPVRRAVALPARSLPLPGPGA